MIISCYAGDAAGAASPDGDVKFRRRAKAVADAPGESFAASFAIRDAFV